MFENPRASWKSYAGVRQRWPRVPALLDLRGGRSADRRAAIAERITRIHFGLVSGNFEMNWEDGEVRFRTGIELTGISPTIELIAALVQPDRGEPLPPCAADGDPQRADPVTAREEREEP